jgi:hypothetical protein
MNALSSGDAKQVESCWPTEGVVGACFVEVQYLRRSSLALASVLIVLQAVLFVFKYAMKDASGMFWGERGIFFRV